MSLKYNYVHNILRLFDILPNFLSTTSETERKFSNKRGIYEFSHELPNDVRLRTLGKSKRISKVHRIIT